MNVQRTASAAFTAAFENEQELRDEHRANLSFGALRLPTSETVALDTVLLVTLRGPWGGETLVHVRVVAALPDGLALAVEGNADEILARLLTNPAGKAAQTPLIEDAAPEDQEPPEKSPTSWDRG